MAKPRVFVSSTYFDLEHIRSSLDLFIDSLGYESILSEKGDIAYSPDIPLDESCYREVENVDVFILLIGPRYGSEATSVEKKESRTFFERYESITKKEYETALNKDIPSYILIETNVYAEYKTYLRNKENKQTNYAHVESINIFRFIEEILAKPRNNPVFTFERYAQIEEWLKSQWAGLFREMLRRRTNQTQLKSLTAEVAGLQEVNQTLKTYLEALMSGVPKSETDKLIKTEEKRLKEVSVSNVISKNPFFEFLGSFNNTATVDQIREVLSDASTFEKVAEELSKLIKDDTEKSILKSVTISDRHAQDDLNKIRKILGLPYLVSESKEKVAENVIEANNSVKTTRRKKKA